MLNRGLWFLIIIITQDTLGIKPPGCNTGPTISATNTTYTVETDAVTWWILLAIIELNIRSSEKPWGIGNWEKLAASGSSQWIAYGSSCNWTTQSKDRTRSVQVCHKRNVKPVFRADQQNYVRFLTYYRHYETRWENASWFRETTGCYGYQCSHIAYTIQVLNSNNRRDSYKEAKDEIRFWCIFCLKRLYPH